LASATIDNRALRQYFDEASKKVLEGKALSSALKQDYRILKKNFLQSLALGEETSEVGKVMENLSILYAQENEDRVKIMLALLEPVMMLLVGLIVGIIVSAMLLPIFSMSLGA
jgi:general secretion pathway protein F/type IV pilus assembly protein PilC